MESPKVLELHMRCLSFSVLKDKQVYQDFGTAAFRQSQESFMALYRDSATYYRLEGEGK